MPARLWHTTFIDIFNHGYAHATVAAPSASLSLSPLISVCVCVNFIRGVNNTKLRENKAARSAVRLLAYRAHQHRYTNKRNVDDNITLYDRICIYLNISECKFWQQSTKLSRLNYAQRRRQRQHTRGSVSRQQASTEWNQVDAQSRTHRELKCGNSASERRRRRRTAARTTNRIKNEKKKEK